MIKIFDTLLTHIGLLGTVSLVATILVIIFLILDKTFKLT